MAKSCHLCRLRKSLAASEMTIFLHTAAGLSHSSRSAACLHGIHAVADRRDAQPAILNDNHATSGTNVRHATPCRDPADVTAPLLSACGAGRKGDGGDIRIRVNWRANLRITQLALDKRETYPVCTVPHFSCRRYPTRLSRF